ncbi:MAG: hypothetical protein HY721_12870 [Planctomycetes bacterium]|nr:hypothetical protein [Planctomycetota bacterium]
MPPCAAAFLLAPFLPACCVLEPVNPSFAIGAGDAARELRAARQAPRRLARPVVVLGGYLDPMGAAWIAREVRRLTGDERVLAVHFPSCGTFDACRDRLIAAVDRAFPSTDPSWTTEVDAIGVSMGGLVARHAAMAGAGGRLGARRLKLARLFTMSTPHRGAAMAELPCFLELHRDMRPGSAFLARLDAGYPSCEYELFPYVQLGDRIVGVRNAAPPGEEPWWVPRGLCPLAHIAVVLDPRIQLDIARRLRGEEPVAREPRSPVPGR